MPIRQVTNPLDPAIKKFGALQRQVYFEADLLIPASVIGLMIAGPMSGRSNFLLVAEEGQELLGGTLFHLMAKANCGFSSFMGVDRAHRGQGLARRLHQARFEVLDRAAGRPVNGLFIDVVAPGRMSAEELEAEHRVGSDPTQRRATFQRLGFRKVNLAYEQPVGGANGGPVTNMDLLFCPREERREVPLEWVLGTLEGYWGGWLGAGRTKRALERLRSQAEGPRVALLSATE
ncbi:MAG: GNAT family N-acetyltransferase [Meiothermus sp.]|nr:GNAT family N-acetyltransferase [Meiothermus sp.]